MEFETSQAPRDPDSRVCVLHACLFYVFLERAAAHKSSRDGVIVHNATAVSAIYMYKGPKDTPRPLFLGPSSAEYALSVCLACGRAFIRGRSIRCNESHG